MHQYVVQWVGDTVEIVQADTSVHIATTDFMPIGTDRLPCLSGTYREGEMLEITDEGGRITGGSATPRLL